MKFGSYISRIQGKFDGFFAQGNETPVSDVNVQTGSVQYVGKAVIGQVRGAEGTRPARNTTDAKFNVNFDKHSVEGLISADNQVLNQDLNFKAQINGNRFTGQNGSFLTQGGFYGKNAGELGGVFSDNSYGSTGVAGAYGAKRQ
ncbi:transferrin-binding protein-like solute binding protein [Pasteurella bettyae]|uniref:Transferrin-binding protein-like solute-binding domain protein n=1 Tax=Pasteurella bettyae CCUG 2042 TaxID=1095749 RepID=I3DAJ6_9PAST|nr:transferrin-binding protein-like solute binding protein [Pasteurella bettyae]EIJ68739.1 transferrin-binding protein-like solute-binding domain protein [Pasteurella bettyae CCUG 2042]SUB20907.1 Transferrin-binding protein 2 precursor [Pasteurella bettyae]